MKRKIKHISCIILILTIIIPQLVSASADYSKKPLYENDEVVPKYEVSCPYGGKHQMFIKGIAYLYTGTIGNRGNLLFSNGVTYQCSKCRLIVASQYNVTTTVVPPRQLGYYCFFTNQPTQTGTLQVFYSEGNYSYNSGGLNTDSFWQGFEWYWAG